jgi:tetratricopeptide (TPR) repeat protein
MNNKNELTEYVSGLLELNDGWEIESFKRKASSVECKLNNNSNDKDKKNFNNIDFLKDNFLGMKVHFFVSISKTAKKITEPFKKKGLKIEIRNEYKKWHFDSVFIDSLSENRNAKLIKGFRKNAWKFEGVDDNISKKIYTTLIKLGDVESRFRYAKFLRKQGDYDEAIKYFESPDLSKDHKIYLTTLLTEKKEYEKKLNENSKNIKKYFEHHELDGLLKVKFETALSYCKKKNYPKAISIMIKLMDYYFVDKKKYFSQIFYFLVLLRKHCGGNKTKMDQYLSDYSYNQELKDCNSEIYNILTDNRKVTTSGILVWIDFVESTKFKYEKVKNNDIRWYILFQYFFNMTTAIFDNFGYKTLKYIGDEIMLFKEFSKNDKRHIQAKQIYDFLFDNQKWYFDEINRLNPIAQNDHEIHVNICISVVKDVLIVNDIKNDISDNEGTKKIYDILGPAVDLSARIKGLAKKKFAVANAAYQELLAKNGKEYSKVFNEYKWKNKLKGVGEEIITYYGKEF